MNIDLELDNVLKEIQGSNPKSVLIQLPDGLKPFAEKIVNFLENNCDSKIYIYFGSCYGACDIPNIQNIDLLVQWGHSEFKY